MNGVYRSRSVVVTDLYRDGSLVVADDLCRERAVSWPIRCRDRYLSCDLALWVSLLLVFPSPSRSLLRGCFFSLLVLVRWFIVSYKVPEWWGEGTSVLSEG